VCLSVCLSVCRSASATLNIAVNRSLPLHQSVSVRSSAASRSPISLLYSNSKLLLLVTLASICSILAVLCVSSCILLRRRRRRRDSRDPEVTSREDKMAVPLCSNGKVAMIHTPSDNRDNNGHVCISLRYVAVYQSTA